MLAVFLIGGLWHGAAWTFVFWGFLHGCAIVIHRIWKNLGFKMNKILAWFITFNFVNITWIFFRAKEWNNAVKVLKGMFEVNAIMLPQTLSTKLSFLKTYGITFGKWLENIAPNDSKELILFSFISLFIILSLKNSSQTISNLNLNSKTSIFASFLFATAILSMNKISEFLYFNF